MFVPPQFLYKIYEKRLLKDLDPNRMPRHVAIIMDGNRRYSKIQGNMEVIKGHEIGVDTLEKVLDWSIDLGIEIVTAYAFSTENWKRPAYEIEALMGLVLNFLEMELFTNNNVKFKMVGDLQSLPESVQKKIHYMEDLTAKYDGMTLVVALSYSSRLEIASVARQIALEVKEGKLNADEITEDTINERLWTNFMPDPDLLIRTGGELRISNYISATPSGPTSMRKRSIRPSPAIRAVSAASERPKPR